jgi:uncharacterized membrane protein
MVWLYYANVTVHVLAAMLWLGGMLFLGVVGAPVLRKLEPSALRQQLFRQFGEGFRHVAWGTIAVLIVTGVANLYFRGWLHWDAVLAAPAFWRTAPGRAFAVKLVTVTLMLAVSAAHDFIYGPRASQLVPDSAAATVFRRRASWLARVNALLGVAVVIAAVLLARS